MRKRRHPDWLKVPLAGGRSYAQMKKMLRNAKLHTICEEAKCPNIVECFNRGTATFLILGEICTRNCWYCHVTSGVPGPLNPDEPHDVAESVKTLGLNYVVITSVTRDDLPDGGANVFAKTITEIKRVNPGCKIEVLIPDFQGDEIALKTVIEAKPDVINHNIEVVKTLFPMIRPQGDYQTSLHVLQTIKTMDDSIISKSGFMVGLGETRDQIRQTMVDLREHAVDVLTIGQYLQPSKHHVPIQKYYTPEEFNEFKETALQLGFRHVESGPLVRSSYHADQLLQQIKK